MLSVLVLQGMEIARALRDQGMNVIECGHGASLDAELRGGGPAVDAVVVGAAVSDPIQTAQRIYRADPAVSVVLLGTGDQCGHLRTGLRFTPFIGTDVDCNDTSASDLLTQITGAADRARVRRAHQRRLGTVNAEMARPKPPRRVPAREQLLAHLVDTAPIGIVALDAQRQIVSVNHEASCLIGLSERDAIGHAFDARTLGATDEAWSTLLATAGETGSSGVFERPAGPVVELRVAAITEVDGNGGYLLVIQDVTERVRAADARNEALERAEEASRLRDEFIAMVSHELRTPMNAILGWSRLIRAGQVSAGKIEHALTVIERNASAQAKLIEDLLDVSRIIGGKMRLDVRSTDVTTVIACGLDAMRIAAAAKGIELSVEIPADVPQVFADTDRLQQVIWNLVSNAVKFTARGGVVRISAGRVESAFEILVTDSGEGISAGTLPYIFDPFRQAEGGTTRQHGGLGLGLAIARRLVELHGGQLTATSDGRGRGATFKVRLPISAVVVPRDAEDLAAAVRTAVAVSSGSGALAGVRVLIVDDDDDTRELVDAVLTSAGAEVTQAASAASALERVTPGLFDLIVSDVGMPGVDGYALVERLRTIESTNGSRLPVIALTAYAGEADRARSLRAGFDAHAAKPIDPVALVSLAAETLASSADRRRTPESAR